MKSKIIDLVLNHIDAAADVDELKDFSDFINWILEHENVWEAKKKNFLQTLHKELLEIYHSEFDFIRKIRLRTAIVNFETTFADDLSDKESKTLDNH